VSRPAPVPSGDTFSAYQAALSRGHQAAGRRDLRAALQAYREAAELAQQRVLPLVLIGRTLLGLKRAEEAVRAFDDALERSPTDAGALAGKAEALARLGRQEAAARVLAELERASTAKAAAADIGAAGGLRAEVLAIAAERAWQDGRHEAAVDEWLAGARAHAADGHVDAALDLCQRALLADPGAGRIHLEMSRHYIAAGLLDHAGERLALLGRLIELEPDDELQRGLIELLREKGDGVPQLAGLKRRLDEPSPP
jgi:tetratricopeptide (TPR) repeat protein